MLLVRKKLKRRDYITEGQSYLLVVSLAGVVHCWAGRSQHPKQLLARADDQSMSKLSSSAFSLKTKSKGLFILIDYHRIQRPLYSFLEQCFLYCGIRTSPTWAHEVRTLSLRNLRF